MTTLDLTKREQPAGVRETRSFKSQFEIREVPNGTGGKNLEFNGYACVTGVAYDMYDMFGPYEELVRAGAFTKTLQEGCDTAFLINHEGMTLARTKPETLNLSEDDTGLHSLALLDPSNPHVVALRSAVDRGDIDEMSFAFRCIRQEWSPDWMQRDILEVSLDKGDVSAVNYGANPFTSEPGMSLRSRQAVRDIARLSVDDVAGALREVRAGSTLSTASSAVLKHVLSLASSADNAVDELQEVLSEFLGVPNPDDDTSKEKLDDSDVSDDSTNQENGNNLSLYQARATQLKFKSRRAATGPIRAGAPK